MWHHFDGRWFTFGEHKHLQTDQAEASQHINIMFVNGDGTKDVFYILVLVSRILSLSTIQFIQQSSDSAEV